MPRPSINGFLSTMMISSCVLSLTFGFFPSMNILLDTGFGEMYLLLFWIPFGISCLIAGSIIDVLKNRITSCICYLTWSMAVVMLTFYKQNLFMTVLLITVVAIITGFIVALGTSFISSNIPINQRGFAVGWRLGLGWGLVAITSYISHIDTYLNLLVIAAINIIVGVSTLVLFGTKRASLEWKQLVNIPKDFNPKKNLAIYYVSSIAFGLFLGVAVFLLGTEISKDKLGGSLFLGRVESVFSLANVFNLYIMNFEFVAVGSFCAIMSPIFGKMIDKIGRMHIFFIANILIPTTLLLFPLMGEEKIFLFFTLLNVMFYSFICCIYVVIDFTVWADLAPERNMARYTGIGISPLGLGGGLGFLLGFVMTADAVVPVLDLSVMMVIVLLLVSSFLPFYFMRESLPPADEMEWASTVIHIYVISQGGVIMCDHAFETKDVVDPNLFSGGISGVSTILQEMVGSEQKVKIIDHEDKKILFEYGPRFTISLVATKNLKILRNKLITLRRQIHDVFWETIGSWDGNLSVFNPIKTMIKNQFIEYMNE